MGKKLGFVLPDQLDEELQNILTWGTKKHVIIGLLWLVVEEVKQGRTDLYHKALEACFKHNHLRGRQ